MRLINYTSLVFLALFLGAYFLKLILLYKKDKIHANVLGKAGKDKKTNFAEVFVKITSFAGFSIWFLEATFNGSFNKFTGWFYLSTLYNYAGLVLMALGILFFVLAMVFMKSSWRVGIDKETETKLITDGLYKISRNPAFVGFDLMFIGLFLTFPDLLTLVAMVANLIAFHLLILREETHLTEVFGKEFIEYRQKTPRYLL